MRCSHVTFAALLPFAALAMASVHAAERPDHHVDRVSRSPFAPSDAGVAAPTIAGAGALDCHHWGRDGRPAEAGTTYGIVANGRSDAAVRRCNVGGLRYGQYLAGNAGVHPTHARALRNMRSHGESPDHSRGAQL